MTGQVGLQLLVFAAVAAVTAYFASRVSVMGAEREALAGELRQARLEAADVLRSVPTGIVTVDGAGHLLYCNPAAEQIFGFKERQWRGRPIMPEFAKIAPEFWAAITATARRGVRAMRVEATVRRPDRTFPIGVTTTTLDVEPAGEPRVTAIFTDISDSKRLEELHLRAERLEAVAELSSSLAHEIKNPLASIRSSVEQLGRAKRVNADEKFLTSLVVRETDRLSRLLSEFLDFSRVRATECRPLDLRTVAAAAIRLVREHPDCPEDAVIDLKGEPTPMEGDEDLLHRVVSILVVDDEMGILDVLRILLKGEGFDVTTAQGGKAGLEALKGNPPDIVLTDIKMPGVSGTEILAAVRDQDPETPVILMTAQASLQSAIQAVNQGAFYYIQKPFSNDDLVAICRRAAEQRILKAENKQLKQEIRRRERSGLVKPLGKSRPFQEVLKLAEQTATTESTVLIQGESGTGKEVIARYIHELSARADGGFFSLNCGALPESLLESELFGHVKGSFTGAVRDKQGLFAAARGGTFFLDEIGEMSPATQVKLLRVLQEREAIPVGGTEPIPVDVRVVAATNRDLEEDIKRGRFRTDLYYRLNVIAIHLPPLRDRRDDIQILWEEFLSRIAKERDEQPKALAEDAKGALLAYDWPGNVRELENALERAVVLSKATTIDLAALPDKLTERRAEPLVADRPHTNPTLDVIERAYITWVLQSEGGNKTRAAEVLGIDPSTLYRKLSRYEGDVPPA